MTLRSLTRRVTRTARTARHLRPSQVAWRLRYRWRRRLPPQIPLVAPSPECATDFPRLPQLEAGEAYGDAELEAMEGGEFTFLHHTMSIVAPAWDWRLGRQDQHRLWVVALHSHRWAYRLARTVRAGGTLGSRADRLLQKLLRRWLEDCDLGEPGSRDLAWNAYVVATRIRWWTALYHELGAEHRSGWGELEQTFRRSLWQQASYLASNLEFDLRANHLLRDAVGLICAGRFFTGPTAEGWLSTGTRLGLAQVREQVLADGGHFERSPMYHLHAMEDVLCGIACMPDGEARHRLRDAWDRMAIFAAWLTHPDGGIPLFNDAAANGCCRPETMLRAGADQLALPPRVPVRRGYRLFRETGLVACHHDAATLVFDVGAVGPDYQPGHAHADTLSIELSVHGARLFVDPGVRHYDRGSEREEDRSTAGHNTVTVDGANSSETWDIFRVGRRARPEAVELQQRGGSIVARGRHDGYRSTHGVTHARTVTWGGGPQLTICDDLIAEQNHGYSGGLLLAPGWEVVTSSPFGWKVRRGQTEAEVVVAGPARLSLYVESRSYSPEFGRTLETKRLSWAVRDQAGCKLETSIRWRRR